MGVANSAGSWGYDSGCTTSANRILSGLSPERAATTRMGRKRSLRSIPTDGRANGENTRYPAKTCDPKLPKNAGELARPRSVRVAANSGNRWQAAARCTDLHQCRWPRASAANARHQRSAIPYEFVMMDLDFLRRRLIIVGGSYIGLEFGQMYSRFGSEVMIIEMAPRLVRHEDEDEDVAAAIKDIIELEGAGVRLSAECISVAKHGDEIIANVDCTDGALEVAGSHLLLAVGRRPNVDDLDLDKAGVRCTSVATSSSTTDCNRLRRASGPLATATARAPSPTPPTTISRSSPRICLTKIRAGSASVSPRITEWVLEMRTLWRKVHVLIHINKRLPCGYRNNKLRLLRPSSN